MAAEDQGGFNLVGAGLAIGVAIGFTISAGVDAKQKKDRGDDQ